MGLRVQPQSSVFNSSTLRHKQLSSGGGLALFALEGVFRAQRQISAVNLFKLRFRIVVYGLWGKSPFTQM